MNQIILKLRLHFFLWVLLALIVMLLFETDLLMAGAWAGSEMTSSFFFFLTATQLLTLAVIPVALKLLHWGPVKRKIRSGSSESMKGYLHWSMLRFALLGVCLLLNLAVYYSVLEKANALCALILFFAYLFCWPSAVKMKAEVGESESECPDTKKKA